ncbi:helix-turn-helix domain-containing protein [Aquabacter cavernae]|uniref:helix-turn-helix domain-containing protein n=1 Tax=Aquabacter cavernae TaxID=2496029 RepID=UPI000F8DC2A1|nr:helix-turn-helix domain-containing protein [Aquabacter cavernae]
MASYKPVAAALRVLDVLAAVNRLNKKASVAEIHRRTGIDKATIVRMLETLAHAGYLVRDADQTIYQVTGKALSLSTAFDRHTVVGTIIAPLMSEFRVAVGWPSDVALFDTDAMLVIKSSREGEPFSFNRAPGFRAPMAGTSLGLAYLAFCPEPERAAILARIAADTGDTTPWSRLVQEPARIARRLEEVRSRGYATMDETYSRIEYEGRIASIGVPIMTERELFASINIIYLTSALSPQAARETLLGPLKDVAARMGTALAEKAAPGIQL